jgi:hypothetical protein
MKYLRHLFIIIIILLSSCNKKDDNNKSNYEVDMSAVYKILESMDNQEFSLSNEQELTIKKYVDSPEGLFVKSMPNLDSENIGFLNDLTEIIVIKVDTKNVVINGKYSNWNFIEFNDIQGWVFGSYLSPKISRERQEGTIDKIVLNICNNLNLVHNLTCDSYLDYLKSLNIIGEWNILEKESFNNRFNNLEEYYLLENGSYIIEITFIPNIRKTLIASLEINLNKNNFISSLFPYININEYIIDELFGKINEHKHDNEIEYLQYEDFIGDTWILTFEEGLLHKLKYYPFVP